MIDPERQELLNLQAEATRQAIQVAFDTANHWREMYLREVEKNNPTKEG